MVTIQGAVPGDQRNIMRNKGQENKGERRLEV
jgi:hypothetical protein